MSQENHFDRLRSEQIEPFADSWSKIEAAINNKQRKALLLIKIMPFLVLFILNGHPVGDYRPGFQLASNIGNIDRIELQSSESRIENRQDAIFRNHKEIKNEAQIKARLYLDGGKIQNLSQNSFNGIDEKNNRAKPKKTHWSLALGSKTNLIRKQDFGALRKSQSESESESGTLENKLNTNQGSISFEFLDIRLGAFPVLPALVPGEPTIIKTIDTLAIVSKMDSTKRILPASKWVISAMALVNSRVLYNQKTPGQTVEFPALNTFGSERFSYEIQLDRALFRAKKTTWFARMTIGFQSHKDRFRVKYDSILTYKASATTPELIEPVFYTRDFQKSGHQIYCNFGLSLLKPISIVPNLCFRLSGEVSVFETQWQKGESSKTSFPFYSLFSVGLPYKISDHYGKVFFIEPVFRYQFHKDSISLFMTETRRIQFGTKLSMFF